MNIVMNYMDKPTVTVRDASWILSLSCSTIKRKIDAGILKCGLSIKYLYNKKNHTCKSYNDILFEYIINLKSREEADTILRDYKIINPSNIRSIIAKRTSTTKQQVPHFYLTIESKVDKLISLRNKINENDNFKISFTNLDKF